MARSGRLMCSTFEFKTALNELAVIHGGRDAQTGRGATVVDRIGHSVRVEASLNASHLIILMNKKM
jgi:hypothetical protein